MKKFILSVMLVASAGLMTSCGTMGGGGITPSAQNPGAANNQQSGGSHIADAIANAAAGGNTGTTGNLIGGLLENLLGSSASLTQEKLVGKWNYVAPDCVFETENFLAKAGGEVAAQKIETKLTEALTKVGVTSGNCSFTFNKDNTCSAVIMGRPITGKYTYNAAEKTVNMTYLGNLVSLTPRVAYVGGKLSLLFESDKLLTLVETIGSMSGNNTVKSLSGLLGNYDGLYIGLQLKK